MNTFIMIIQFLPQIINIIKKMKAMVDDGLTKEEVQDALNKMEMAFNNIADDTALASELDDQWVRNNETQESVHTEVSGNNSTKAETHDS